MLPQAVHSFQFDHLPIRVLTDDAGDPWFVAKDVAALLGYSNTRKAVSDHCRMARPVGGNGSLPLDPQTLIIPERDLYRMIMRSRLEAAERFEDWVVGDVLPSIRKTGSYAMPQRELTRMELLQIAMESEQARIQAEAERDHAVATKALIGSKREATAMATASAATKKAKQLEEKLGFCIRHATVTAVENATRSTFPKNAYVALRAWCRANGVTAVDVVDPRFGSVKAWPAGAWLAAFDVDLKEIFEGVQA